jgi:hypothetical protein
MPETTKSDADINAPSELAAVGNPYTKFRGARRDRDFRNWPEAEAMAPTTTTGFCGAPVAADHKFSMMMGWPSDSRR